MRRRQYLKSAGSVVLVGAIAGCGGDGKSESGPTVINVSPQGGFAFEPSEVTISVGDTVKWVFKSENHNVSLNPQHTQYVSIPDGAQPAASVDDPSKTNPKGSSWSHTFETAGEYNYACVPHALSGHTGTVIVEE